MFENSQTIMKKSDEGFVEKFVKEHEESMEALGNEEKHDLYQNKKKLAKQSLQSQTIQRTACTRPVQCRIFPSQSLLEFHSFGFQCLPLARQG